MGRVEATFRRRSQPRTISQTFLYPKGYSLRAKTAKALALKTAKAVETLEINSMDGITAAQTYRNNLWPSVSPSIMPALEAARRGERLVVSEETKKYVEQLKTLM